MQRRRPSFVQRVRMLGGRLRLGPPLAIFALASCHGHASGNGSIVALFSDVCAGQPDWTPCDDGNPNTLRDVCHSGVCSGVDIGATLTNTVAATSSGSDAGEPDGITPGKLGGDSFKVTDDGDAAYRIPIWVPDGRNGVQPNIALAYSSSGGDSPMGVGWRIDGLSRISRCHADFAHELSPQPIQYDETDKLCLDGERLILVSGVYNSTNSEYRTEDDKFMKIKQVGSDALGPTGFLVYLRDGRRISYGSETAPTVAGYQGDPSAVLQGSRATVTASDTDTSNPTVAFDTPVRLAWAMASSRDRYDNQVQYTYVTTAQTDANEFTIDFRPSQINYTVGPTGPTDRSVHFVYNDEVNNPRYDVQDSFVAGLPLRVGHLLTAIDMFGPAPTAGQNTQVSLLREYRLGYQNELDDFNVATQKRTLLTNVQECDGRGVCKSATTFGFTAAQPDYDRIATGQMAPPQDVLSNTMLAADIDGDGRDDLVFSQPYGGSPSGPGVAWIGFLSTGTGLGSSTLLLAEAVGDAQFSPFLGSAARAVDLDLDGKTDLILPQSFGGSPRPGRFALYRSALPDGINGHPLANYDVGTNPEASGDDWFGSPSIYAGDFNGDGLPDLMRAFGTVSGGTNSWSLRLNQPRGALGQYLSATLQVSGREFDNIATSEDWNAYALDLDGDGKQELLFRDAAAGGAVGTRMLALGSLGDVRGDPPNQIISATATPTSLLAAARLPGSVRYQMVDVNGDGLKDAIEIPISGGIVRVAINNGRDFMPPVQTELNVGQSWDGVNGTTINSIDPGVRVIDYDLDGRSDLLYLGDLCIQGAAELTNPEPFMYRGRGTLGEGAKLRTAPRSSFTSFWNNVPLGDPGFSPSQAQNYQNGVCANNYSHSQTLDLNGDGLTDFAQVENGEIVVYVRRGPKPYLLNHVTNGMGHTIDVGYKPISDSSVYKLTAPSGPCTYPQSCVKRGKWVVSDHELDLATNNELAYSHSYDTARTDLTLGWLGMDAHTIVDQRTLATSTIDYDHVSRYGGVYPYRSRPTSRDLEIPLWSNGKQIHRSWGFTYDVSWGGVGTPVAVTPTVSTFTETEGFLTGPSSLPSSPVFKRGTTTTTDYDSNTGFLRSRTRDNGDGSSDEIEKCVYTPYPDQPDVWLVGMLQRETTTYTTPFNWETDAPGESVTRTVAYARDLTTGALTGLTLEPDSTDPNLHLETSYTLNAAGQVHVVTEKALPCAAPATGQNCSPENLTRSWTVDYDPTSGIYPYTLVNPLEQTTLLIYHPGIGLLATVTDANNLTITRQYDGFGRLTLEQRADEIASTHVYRTDPDFGFPLAIDTTSRGGLETADFDQRGEEVLHLRRDENGQFNQVRTDYDAYGHVQNRWRPYPQAFAGEEPGLPFTSYTYDEAERVTSRSLFPSYESWSYDVNTVKHFVSSDSGDAEDDTIADVMGRPMQRIEKLGPSATQPAHDVTTTYGYGPFGVSRDVIDTYGYLMHMDYDVRGRRTQISDPDTGVQIDVNNAFSELTSTTDANNQTVRFDFDPLGRPTAEELPTGNNVYAWDTAPNGVGLLASTSSPDGVSVSYEYNARKRLSVETSSLAGGTFRLDYGYDDFGRRGTIQYPVVEGARYQVQYSYTPLSGELLNIVDANQSVLWEVDERNPERNIVRETAADGFVTERGYEPERGYLASRTVSLNGTAAGPLQTMTFHHDMRGYLDQRSEDTGSGPIFEQFQHDQLGRLKAWYSDNWITSYDYDDIGNMVSRELDSPTAQDVTTYWPAINAGPHAVSAVTRPDGSNDWYGYDSAGQQVSGPDRTVDYTTFGLPSTMTKGGNASSFGYDAFHQRSVKQSSSGTTLYVSELYEKRITPSATTHVMYIPGGGRIVAQVTQVEGGSQAVTFLHEDHLGSISAMTSSASSNVTRVRFDPFGLRLDPDSLVISPTTAGPPDPSVTKGFTGHEEDDELALINMNGRVYDPDLARFLTPDPHVSRPHKSQSFNRYSYVENSPLRFIDLTGFDGEDGGDEGPTGGPSGPSGPSGGDEGGDEGGQNGGTEPSDPGSNSNGPPGGGDPGIGDGTLLAMNTPDIVITNAPGGDGPSPGTADPDEPSGGPPSAPPDSPPGPQGGPQNPNTTDDGAPSGPSCSSCTGPRGSAGGPGPEYGTTQHGGDGHGPGPGFGGVGSGQGGPSGGGHGPGGGEGEGQYYYGVPVGPFGNWSHEGVEGLVSDLEHGNYAAHGFELTLEGLGAAAKYEGAHHAAESMELGSKVLEKMGLVVGLAIGGIKYAHGTAEGNAVEKLEGAIAIGAAIGGFIIGGPIGVAFVLGLELGLPALLGD